MDVAERVDEYICSYKFEKNKFYTDRKRLRNGWANTQLLLDCFPDAKAFLENSRRFWHNLAIKDLYSCGMLGSHFVNAQFFLEKLTPRADSIELCCKYDSIKHNLYEWHKKTMKLVCGAALMIDWAENNKKRGISLEITSDDEDFIGYYKERAEIEWRLKAGLWPYMLFPYENKHSNFYSNLSDYLICMISGLSGIEEKIHDRRKIMIN